MSNQEGSLTPISPERLVQELRKLSASQASGELSKDAYEHRFSRMITELRERSIGGNRAEILAAISPLQQDGTISSGDWARLLKQLGLG